MEIELNRPGSGTETFFSRINPLHWRKRSRTQIGTHAVPQQFSGSEDEVIAFFRGWDQAEEIRSKDEGKPKIEIIDSDLVRSDIRYIFRDYDEVRPTLKRLSRAVKNRFEAISSTDPQRSQWELLVEQLKAAKAYLHTVEGWPELKPNLRGSVSEIMGVELEWIKEEEIDSLEDAVSKGLFDMGIKNHNLTEAFATFRKKKLSEADLRVGINWAARVGWSRVAEYLKVPDLSREFGLPDEWLEFNAENHILFRMDARFIQRKPHVKINTNPKLPYLRGDDEVMPIHEIIGHIQTLALWMKGVDEGTILAPLGITTLFGPRTYPSEGEAQAMTLYIQDNVLPLSPLGRLALDWRALRDAVLNNAEIIAVNPARSEVEQYREALGYAKKHLPIFPREEIKSWMDARSGVLETDHDWVSGKAVIDFRKYAKMLGSSENKRRFIRELKLTPMSSSQVHNLVVRIMTKVV